MRLIVCVFFLALTSASWASDYGKGKKKGTSLFDLQERMFDPKNGPDDRVALEDQFIRQGNLYEKNPLNYINEMFFGKMMFQDAKRSLYDYKNDYYYRFQISNIFFEDTDNFKTLDEWALEDLPQSYLFKRFVRKEKLLESLWNTFGENILELLKPHFSEGSYQLKVVDALVRTHECIYAQENAEAKVDGIIKKLDEENPDPANMIGYMEPIICEDIATEFARQSGSDYYKWQDVQWLHSFWVRRQKEGNLDLSLKILNSFLIE